MSYQAPGPQGLDYKPCRYGASRLTFRGPARSLDRPFIAFLGSTETYGKYVPQPFPALVEAQIGTPCINLGCVNGGHDVYLNDPYVMELAGQARICVLQISGAQNMSNRFYTVHPRRNDRFLKASRFMRQIFRDVDFTDFTFTRHMLDSLHHFAPDRFAMLRNELQEAWVARTRLMLERLEGRVILLWFAGHRPPNGPAPDGVGPDPLFIERHMIEAVQGQAAAVVEATVSASAMAAGQAGMVIPPAEAQAAAEMPGPAAHADAADMLLPVLRRYV